jgi:outer membrane protein TolC
LRALIDGNFGVWSLVGNIVAPLWDGGRLRAQVSRADARGAEALANYATAALTAYAEVETALAAEEFLAERERHLNESVEQARAAEQLAQERYRSGLETYITVLDSQRSAVNAEAEHIVARRLRLENRVDLYLALGGGFEQLEAPVQLERIESQ